MNKMKTILIANRGEPVRRAIKTLRRLNIRVATIATEADQLSDWVAESDLCLTVSSYLAGSEIVKKAKDAHVDGIWPGWGFLSENEGFAKEVADNGLMWIGPSHSVIQVMGSKSEATIMAKKAGLQTIPEVTVVVKDRELNETLAEAKAACQEIGFPILLKPALGGGGQGQMVLEDLNEFDSAWQQVVQINQNLFQAGPILVQKFFDHARHIESQVLADSHGHVVVLGERECSIQRRNQKVIEEAPSPALTDEERAGLIESSAQFARTVGYTSAGTIEYLYSDQKFYFLEMNTRLQVEHPVTEEVMRVEGKKLDLIEEMICIANGEELSFSQSQVQKIGHALEARIYAEDPEKNYQPAPGQVVFHQFPHGEDVRMESSFVSIPAEISPQYDPMIAKMVVWGETRDKAVKLLAKSLDQTVILGVPTNVALCKNLTQDELFLQGEFSTRFLAEHPNLACLGVEDFGQLVSIAAAIRYSQDLRAVRQKLTSSVPTSSHHVLRHVPETSGNYTVEYGDKEFSIAVSELKPNSFRIVCGEWVNDVQVVARTGYSYTATIQGGKILPVWAHSDNNLLQIKLGSGSTVKLQLFSSSDGAVSDPHSAPMAGQVVAVFVKPGQNVSEGEELYHIESMKMITPVRAKHGGEVTAVCQSVGEAVKAGDVVVEIPALADKSDESGFDAKQLGQNYQSQNLSPLDVLAGHFCGFDTSDELLSLALKELDESLQNKNYDQTHVIQAIVRCFETCSDIEELFENNEHVMTFLAEQSEDVSSLIPEQPKNILKKLMQAYSVTAFSELATHPMLVRMFQSRNSEKKDFYLGALAEICDKHGITDQALLSPVTSWLQKNPDLSEEVQNHVWNFLYKLDATKYYEIAKPPVAMEFFDEYNQVKKDPFYGLDRKACEDLIASIEDRQAVYTSLEFKGFPDCVRPHLQKWFSHFHGRELTLPKELADQDIYLFELVVPENDSENKVPPRFSVIGLVSEGGLEVTPDGHAILPQHEKSAIAAFRTLRLVQRGSDHHPNKVFLMSKDGHEIPWRTRDTDSKQKVLTPQTVKDASMRVSGFATGIQIESTEVVMPLRNDVDQKTYWTVIEVRHSGDQGVISRPPFLIDEREAKKPLDIEEQMNERQHRMGKLLNRDRAHLLFDDGQFEELFFPEVDDKPGIGLNVYKGTVNGIETLAYAGDFRFRGGALGEREGKKLAAAVVLSYLSNKPLVAFHDGAGANIKESVSSLGWAGAYFGAIAHTGGFSTPEKFRYWIKNHIGKDYFEKVLNKFCEQESIDALVDGVKRQLVHFHLHVGATVGMLVYGASIAHASLMCDQPESYRVLTGAGTVKKVLGENATNYSLGGAKAHGENSGDIEMTFSSEEDVIDHTRKLLRLFLSHKSQTKIQRDQALPTLDVPKKAGIILGRDALKAQIDNGEFFEIRPQLKEAGGILTGYAAIAGQPVAIAVTATDYGLSHPNAFKKVTQLVEAAQDLSLPLIIATGAQWEAPSLPVSTEWLQAREEFYQALKRLTVPKIGFALGARALEQSVLNHLDVYFAVKRGDESDEEINRARAISGYVAESVTEAFDLLPDVLTYLQAATEATIVSSDEPTRVPQFKLPDDITEAYDMRAVIKEIFDDSKFFELYSADQLPLITGFASLAGQVIGVIADNPQVESGAQNVDSITKFTRFNRICERFNIPIIELNDSPAFRPGTEQEHKGIQGVGGRSIREECLSRNTKIAVTLRQNYGGRYIHANLVTLGAPRAGLALEGAKIGVMGAKGAVGVLYRKKLIALPESERADAEARWQKQYEDEQLNPQHAVDLQYITDPVSVSELRKSLCEVLRKLDDTL